MDLALLVYFISLLAGVGKFFVTLTIICGVGFGFFAMWKFTETTPKSYYDSHENERRVDNGVLCLSWMKRFAITGLISTWVLIFLPSEKTAYMMVGAYAAQKVGENPKVQEMSGKVLKIVESKLDKYVDEAENKVLDQVETKTKRKSK